jgi:hypothetical protein
MYSAAQPLSFGQILDRVFRLSRQNLKSLLAISIVPGAAYALAALAAVGTIFLYLRPDRGVPQQFSHAQIAVMIAVILASTLVTLLVFAVFQPAICHAVLQANRGMPTGFREAYRIAWSRKGRYVWLMILKALFVAGPTYGAGILIALLAFLGIRTGAGAAPSFLFALIPLLMLVYFVGMLYAAFAMIRLSLATPACVAEDLPAMAAIRRSMRLSRNAKGRIFLIGLVMYAINCAAMMIVEAVAGLIVALGAFFFTLMHLNLVTEIVLGSIFGVGLLGGVLVLTGALWASFSVAFTLVYRDQCLRVDPQPERGTAI